MAAGEVVATTTFVTWHDGVEVVVSEGDHLPADHAIVEAQPQWFEPAASSAKAKARRR